MEYSSTVEVMTSLIYT